MMARECRLRMWGPVQLERDGHPLAGLESRKALALLCYIVSEARPITRAHLVDLFWGEQPEERGRGNLRRVLHNLATVLPGWLVTTRDTVQFDPSGDVWVDTLTFAALVKHGTPAALADAVALARGDFLAGLDVDGCPEFEAWQVVAREHWRQRLVDALQRLAALHAQRQEYEAAQAYAHQLIALDPWREEAHRLLMRLLALSGQRSAALAQYETCRRLLAEELGVAPSTETTALYDQIRRGALGPAPTRAMPPHNLPTSMTELLGRESDLDTITGLVSGPTSRLVTLVGPGGVGKTRLALAAAQRLLTASESDDGHPFPDGVFFVALDAVTAPSLVAPAIAQALGVRVTDGLLSLVRLKSYLRAKRLLLVLDNFEQVAAAAPQIADLLHSSPGLKVIVTSRTPLRLYGEHEFAVAPLALPDLDNLPPLTALVSLPIVRLFLQRARAVRPDFTFDAAEARAVAEICVRLDGLPLAVELAAARLRSLTPPQVLAGLASRLTLLTDGPIDHPARLQALRNTIAWSDDLLDEADRVAFHRLAVFSGGFTLAAAQAILIHVSALAARLASQVDKSLIQIVDGVGEATRYTMLATIREYALERLATDGEEMAVRRRHAEHYLRWAEEVEPRLTGEETQLWLDREETERHNFWAALMWAREMAQVDSTPAHGAVAPLALGLRLGAALWRLWVFRGYLNEARRWMEEMLDLAEPPGAGVTPEVLGKAWHATGNLARNQGDYAAAGRCYEAGLAQQRLVGDKAAISRALHGVGNVAYNVADYPRATAYFEEALAIKRELGDTWGTALELELLGEVAYCQGDFRPAEALLSEALALYQSVKDQWGTGMCLGTLGILAHLQGDDPRAAAITNQSMTLHEAMGYKRGVALTLASQGNLALDAGRLEEAARLLEESLKQCRTLGETWGMALALEGLARLAYHQGDGARAAACAEESVSLFQATGDRRYVARALQSLARAARLQDHRQDADDDAFESLTLYRAIGDRWGLVNGLLERATGLAWGRREGADLGDTQALRLLAAAEATRAAWGYALPPVEQAEVERCLSLARQGLTATEQADAWQIGLHMTLDEALDEALTVRLAALVHEAGSR